MYVYKRRGSDLSPPRGSNTVGEWGAMALFVDQRVVLLVGR